jgi:hypothetical protein
MTFPREHLPHDPAVCHGHARGTLGGEIPAPFNPDALRRQDAPSPDDVFDLALARGLIGRDFPGDQRRIGDFTENEKAVIRERKNGWEKASVATLAAVFSATAQTIATILREVE